MVVAPASDDSNRLPTSMSPSHYSIRLLTDLEALIYKGASIATVTSKGFLLSADALGHESHSDKRWLDHVEYDGEKASLFFQAGKIDAGEYKMALRWHGELNASMKGYIDLYYTSTYPRKGGKDGQTDVFACTQFQSTSARRAFGRTTSLSNMHVDKVETVKNGNRFPQDDLLDDEFYSDSPIDNCATGNTESEVKAKAKDWHIVHFHPTPLLSSYLVAFANGQLEHREDSFASVGMDGKERDVILRFYATWDQIDRTLLALETTRRLVPKYEQVFDIAFPLLKLDSLVVNDFDLGAMENLGGSIAARKGVVSITSHEISHTWFGDMVSMDWWSGLYLNEAFATLMGECLMIDRLEPAWNVHASFISEHLGRALKLDAMRSSHPIEVRVPDEAAISQAFDAISYSKGASVLKQLCQWIGEDKFIEGVTIYLKKHLWGNTATMDLWEGIAESSGEDVAKVMDSWVNKIGFPYVQVEESAKGLKLTQHRFLGSGDATSEEDATLWHIPLQLLTVDSRTGECKIDRALILSEREMEIVLPDVEKAIYKRNAESCGLTMSSLKRTDRVLYPASRLDQLGREAARPDSLLENLLFPFLSLANLIAPTEKEYLVFSEISSALSSISSVWWEENELVQEGLAKLKKGWFGKEAKRLGLDPIEGERLEDVELRALSWSAMASSEDQETIKEFQRRFRPFLDSNDSFLIPSDLFSTIFRTCVQHGGSEEYVKALDVVFARPNSVQFSAAVSALCSTRDEKRLEQTLEFVLSKQVKTQDVNSFFAYLSMNPLAKRKLWALLKANFETLIKRLDGNFQAPIIFGRTFNTFTSDKDADEVEHFFEGKGPRSDPSQRGMLRRDRKDLRTWLHKNDYISV
ncbi:BQ2448_6526 [Microbotryum intermedium]|uniref:Aminopeptidase n=1 Tax=Microbotryum intermedium TaxID=269621 RepID=A0A238FQD0_9BASI|nr:BQ2448_6526 [Microbotryum intermedium]